MRYVEIIQRPETRTIGETIRRHAKLHPEHPAIVASGFRNLSYRELQDQIDAIGTGLLRVGLDRGARIVVAVESSPEAALAIVAVASAATAVPLDPKLTIQEVEKLFALIRPKAVLLLKDSDSAARKLAEQQCLTVIELIASNDGALNLQFVPQFGIKAGLDYANPNTPAFILLTSGTLAEPKLVPYSHRNMLAAAERLQLWYELTPLDRCLSVTPLWYAHALQLTIFTPLLTGGSVAFPINALKVDLSEWLRALMPTWYSAGPTLHLSILEQIKSQAGVKCTHSLRFAVSSGASLPKIVHEQLQSTLGVPLLEQYGSSETSAISTNRPPPSPSKPGTCGIPWPDTVIITGENGEGLAPGKQGEILVSGPTVISGYLNAPELNRTRFVDGLFRTGDTGSFDEDGFLSLHGRKDDLINRGAEKISPSEIDDALMRHPAVAEAAAFPVPHPRLGEDVVAAIVLRPSMTVRPVELRRYLRERLASFKVPRRIVIRDQLPKGQTGKILRRQLTECWEDDSPAEARIPAVETTEDTSVDNGIIVEVKKIWERLLKISPLSADDDFFENGGDSLLAMEMLAELELLSGRTLSIAILFDAPTIGQLARKLSEKDHLRRKSLFRLHSNGNQTPLFYFHGEFNSRGYSALKLAGALGSDQPLFVIDPHGMGEEPIPETIEAMAADRLPLIMDAYPEGPYRLFGNCLGGIVAFEVARLLINAGKRVELVVMLDPPTVSASKAVQMLLATMRRVRPIAGSAVDRTIPIVFSKCADFQKFRNISWTRRWSAISTRARNLAAGGAQAPVAPAVALEAGGGEGPLTYSPAEQRRRIERETRYTCAMSYYVPAPLAVRIVYFALDYGGGALRRLSPDCEIIKLSGDHYVYEYAEIARHLRLRL